MLPCVGCAYRKSIPGNTHIRCGFDWSQNREAVAVIFKDVKPRVSQWFRFPFNYDPVWGPDTCPERADTADPAKVAPSSPLADLLSLLG